MILLVCCKHGLIGQNIITYFDSNGLSDGQANSLADLLAALAQASCATSAPPKSDPFRSLQIPSDSEVPECDGSGFRAISSGVF